MAAVILEVIPAGYTTCPKNIIYVFANTDENNIVSKNYCIAYHDDNMSFLTKWRSDIYPTDGNKVA